ncbi:hypothetical protein [Burkholderia cepacia]|uniref:hypothetical protein n=1 Tax=Burkholderia cepacia TaxID=292 RepID=UPI0012D8D051|nr:hypothetical protein [Burkholderia cepacia]
MIVNIGYSIEKPIFLRTLIFFNKKNFMTKFSSEAELQALVLEAIRSQQLSTLITDTAKLRGKHEEVAANILPHFSIDYLCRSASIRAGARVLNALDNLVILSSDTDVSLEESETLRPDIVCFSPELQSIVLFELKNSSSPGRQAVSELAAYEQEIKNHLPLLAERDICLIILSTEWNTLMDHGVSAAITWSGKNILCLHASNENGALTLRTRIPKAWTITGSVFLPNEALATSQLTLYRKDEFDTPGSSLEPWHTEDETASEYVPHQMITAVELIAREGDVAGGHGFVLLWRDHSAPSPDAYCITVCSVSPFAIYEASQSGRNSKSSALAGALDKVRRDFFPSGHSSSFFSICESAASLLAEVSRPVWESPSTWSEDKISLSLRAEPLICEFWGALGRYAREYVANPSVRAWRQLLLQKGEGDWRNPDVALSLVAQFMRPQLFGSGNVRWSDAFQLGVFVGLDRFLRENLQRESGTEPAGPLLCRFLWNRMDLVLALDEMSLLADSADIARPADPIEFYSNPLKFDTDQFDRLVEWICEDFLMGSGGHINAFICGVNGAAIFDDSTIDSLIDDDYRTAATKAIEEEIRSATEFVLDELTKFRDEGGLLPKGIRELNRLTSELGLNKVNSHSIDQVSPATLVKSWRACLSASDWLAHGVLHLRPSLSTIDVDWEWLRQGVSEAYARGQKNVGVILSANGVLGTGTISPGGMRIPITIDDPREEVLFEDQSAMFTSIRRVTWTELMAMKEFPGQ